MKKLSALLLSLPLMLILVMVFCNHKTGKSDVSPYKKCPKNAPPEMSCVPGGPFIMGSDSKRWTDENPPHKVDLSTFLMDKYEVTTEEYQNCVKEKKCTYVRSNYRQMRGPKQPQVKVNWFQARDYCRSRGKRLPTEAEFEKASRGPNGNIYPWGNEKADCSRAVIMDKGKRGCTDKYGQQGITAEVGSRKPYVYGLYDMSGNVHEWVNDWYEKSYTKCGKACLDKDPKGPCDGKDDCPGYTEKVVKGGSWYWNWDWARAAKRRAWRPINKPPHHFGFRCAKDVE